MATMPPSCSLPRHREFAVCGHLQPCSSPLGDALALPTVSDRPIATARGCAPPRFWLDVYAGMYEHLQGRELFPWVAAVEGFSQATAEVHASQLAVFEEARL